MAQVCVTDIGVLANEPDERLLDLPISKFLNRHGVRAEPVTCAANISVLALMELFAHTRSHRVFVVSSVSHRVLAIATLSGLFRAIAGVSQRSDGGKIGAGSTVDATAGSVPIH